jgi:hypothetical protein
MDDDIADESQLTLNHLRPGEQFVYEFDFGDSWLHLCTVGERRIDPIEALGIRPGTPLPYSGWGDIPDQYGRRWDDEASENPSPDPEGADLPDLGPWQRR